MTEAPVVLVANRGEVAVRILRSVSALGWVPCAVYAEDEVDPFHARLAGRAIALPGAGPAAYLDAAALVAAAQAVGATLLHPGYGFLSESPDLAQRCLDAGVTFVGPTAATLALLGDKVAARQMAEEQAVPVSAGTGPIEGAAARQFLTSLGSGAAVMVKPVAGGGGVGVSVVDDPSALDEAIRRCASVAASAFGSGQVFLEALVPHARHIEVQVLGDGDRLAYLGDRDCSIQRHRQKLVEFAPAPALDPAVRRDIADAAQRMATSVGYRGLCTFEFLVDLDHAPGRAPYTFMEANPRLQVEHTVTEQIYGIDLVRAQLEVANGATLDELGMGPLVAKGVAVEARINAETVMPDGTVQPSSGVVTVFEAPTGPGVRTDTAAAGGSPANPRYDSLLAKVIGTDASGSLAAATRRTGQALAECRVEGVDVNIALLRAILVHPDVVAGRVDTRFVDRHLDELLAAAAGLGAADEPVAGSADRRGGPRGRDDGSVVAPMAATVVEIPASVGDVVGEGQVVVLLEAMKMEHWVTAPWAGQVRTIFVTIGQSVGAGDVLVLVDRSGDDAGEVVDPEEIDLDAVRPELAEYQGRRRLTLDEGRPDVVSRRHRSGRRTARENLDDLCDPGSFVEYGGFAIAAQRQRRSLDDLIERTPADGLVTGIGRINGDLFAVDATRAAVLSYDYTVLAGTQGQRNHHKKDRLFELAARHRLPVVLFAEGGGGRPGDTDMAGVAGLDTAAFRLFAALSGRVPLIGVVSGRCFAGNAALLGCCDVIIATPDANIGMGGPAMIDGGGLGSYRPEDVGPASVQEPNGVIDLLVDDEAAAVATAKRYLSYFQGRLPDWESADQRLLRSVVPERRVRVYDTRRVIDILCDRDSVLELRPRFGTGMVTVLARIEGRPVGVLANDPRHLGGAIDRDGADKAARFLQLCEAHGLPVVSLCDTPGFMVGPDAERDAQVRHFSRMFVVTAALTVPLVTVILRKGYGLGAMAMAGGSFRAPVSTVSWPTGEFGGMGLEGAVRLGYARELEAIADPGERHARFEAMVARAYESGKALNAATYFEFDDVIDPAATRSHVASVLAVAGPAGAGPTAARYVDPW